MHHKGSSAVHRSLPRTQVRGKEVKPRCFRLEMLLTRVAAARQASQGKSWDNRQRVWVDSPSTALALDDDAFAGVRQQWNASAMMRCALPQI